MSISLQCDQCGRSYTMSEEHAGKKARCKQCGHVFMIPQPALASPAADDLYALEELPPRPSETELLAPRADVTTKAKTKSKATKTKSKASHSDDQSTLKKVGGGMLVLAIICLRVYFAWNRAQGPKAAPPAAVSNQDGPIAVPRLPDVGPGRELAPGITFHEMHLPGGSSPGFSGKLWLYLPSGEHAEKSLPCVLITGAGSNVISGMELADGDRAEHLPYVRSGFAVLAYELDGMLQNRDNPGNTEIQQAGLKFLAARAGLVNAHIALEFLLHKVPQVDPERIYTAGHSSAGVMAMLFAEHEPRLKGCVAYAPAIDLEERFGFLGTAQVRQLGLGDLVTRYSPRQNEAKLNCPLFLFHALDDSNVSVSMSQASAERLRRMGKNVTFVTVPTGNHYDSMIQQGIPRAIEWLEGLSRSQANQPAPAAPAAAQAQPSSPAPATPPPSSGFPAPPGAPGFPPPPGSQP